MLLLINIKTIFNYTLFTIYYALTVLGKSEIIASLSSVLPGLFGITTIFFPARS